MRAAQVTATLCPAFTAAQRLLRSCCIALFSERATRSFLSTSVRGYKTAFKPADAFRHFGKYCPEESGFSYPICGWHDGRLGSKRIGTPETRQKLENRHNSADSLRGIT
ncbi:MAG: hypothetical protein LBF16_01055 [Pseudomonadales bacterium]|jgi:hypothetical protein|nr:hypothetical protein [Pseudomonadales bacterium]